MAAAVHEVTMPREVDPVSKQHGDALRAIRREKRLPHKTIVGRLEMAESTYRSYELGYRRIRLDQIPSFAAAYEITAEELSSRLGLRDISLREIRAAECSDLMGQLEGQPPEVVETVLRWWRDSIQIAKLHLKARDN